MSKVLISIGSILTLILAIVIILLLNLGLVGFGAWISGLDSDIGLNRLSLQIIADHWSYWQVHLTYMLPWLIMLLITLFIGRRLTYPLRKTKQMLMLKSWLFLILIILVLLIPAMEIIAGSGIYHSLLWLGLTKFENYFVSVVLLLLFINGSARLGPFFAALVKNNGVEVKRKGPLHQQLVYIMVVPVIVLIYGIGILYNFSLDITSITFISGMVFAIGLTYYQVMNYDVIVR